VDEALAKWAGEFGRAQAARFALASLAWSLEALHTLVTVFADRDPPWLCIHPPPLPDYSTTPCSSSPLHSSPSCSMDRRSWEWAGGNSQSTVSEWDLVCAGGSYKKGLAQSAFFVGCLIG
jgi:OCT family organic cation transporter-like MFS transporter 4/5